jgi:hypothetical protein
MTQAAEILIELQGRGVSVNVEGDILCLTPKRALDDALLIRVREAKPAILEVLRKAKTCWHCGGSGECNCSTCGVMKPSVVWAAGECVTCKARRTRLQ